MRTITHIFIYVLVINSILTMCSAYYAGTQVNQLETTFSVNETAQLWRDYDATNQQRSETTDNMPSVSFAPAETGFVNVMQKGVVLYVGGMKNTANNALETQILDFLNGITKWTWVLLGAILMIAWMTKSKEV